MENSHSQPRVLVTGVFDLLHEEHINLLHKAAELGELIVGIESDKRVRELKGEGRPVNDQLSRKAAIEKLGVANEVFILPEQFSGPGDHKALLQKIKPNILAVSSSTPHLDRKSRLMQEIGGRVEVVHQHNPEISTTQLLEKQKGASYK